MASHRFVEFNLRVNEDLLIDLELDSVADLMRNDVIRELKRLTKDPKFQDRVAGRMKSKEIERELLARKMK